MTQDKQLQRIQFDDVLAKRQRGQALNAKEFAVLAGISYSSAREWFQMPGFPRIQGVVFWEDFVEWRKVQNPARNPARNNTTSSAHVMSGNIPKVSMPARAAQILAEATK